MRTFLLMTAAALSFAGATSFGASDANAAVCADGVYRAGCAGPRGAVVVRKPPPTVTCNWVWINGVKVRRCT